MTIEAHDPETGEVLQRAADGGILPPAARSTADFIRMINQGQFDADVSVDLQRLAEAMEDRFQEVGGKVKGSITLSIDFVREPEGMYMMTGSHKVKVPAPLPRGRTVGWLTEQNFFTPNPPRQGQLFSAPREVPINTQIRN